MAPASPLYRFLACLALAEIVQGGYVDMDTPLDKRTTTSFVDGSIYHLVMSDEFNIPNRTFKDGHDPVWTALDKSDDDSSSAGGGSMQFYNSSNVKTINGSMVIETTLGKTSWVRYDHTKKVWKEENKYFKSGMVQSWNKFCFTGGIIEVDMIIPGHPFIGGLWPAVWMLGNLGRATYEASTNNIWPWSYDKCDRSMQQKQDISACNIQNHFGMNPRQGRGATEIDIIEVMTGDSNGFFKATNPGVALPYADMTLQIAPGIEKNRPQSGGLPSSNATLEHGFTKFAAQTWYEGLEYAGNTSINPFFYGTYLAETKLGEPVTRTKKQAFQADAVGVVHQLVPSHFQSMHTIRLEWQPGPGGRLDWYTKGYKRHNENGTYYETGDGEGKDWVPVFSIKDAVLNKTMGSQIPIEPTYLIMNTAVSSTWGFPYDVPEWCNKCYDCDDPTCACAFYPGFCPVMRKGDVAMKIDSIRVYQSRDPSAHVGANHTVGCDPPEYPTSEWIRGHEYRYMRNPPFVNEDIHPLRAVQNGGGECKIDDDCGASIHHVNLTEAYEASLQGGTDGSISVDSTTHETTSSSSSSGSRKTESRKLIGMGRCVAASSMPPMISKASNRPARVCVCNPGYTGPHCHAQDHFGTEPSAESLKLARNPFLHYADFDFPPLLLILICTMITVLLIILMQNVQSKNQSSKETSMLSRPKFVASNSGYAGERQALIITGTSV